MPRKTKSEPPLDPELEPLEHIVMLVKQVAKLSAGDPKAEKRLSRKIKRKIIPRLRRVLQLHMSVRELRAGAHLVCRQGRSRRPRRRTRARRG